MRRPVEECLRSPAATSWFRSRPIAAAIPPPRAAAEPGTEPVRNLTSGNPPGHAACADDFFRIRRYSAAPVIGTRGACHAAILACRHCHAGCADGAGGRPATTPQKPLRSECLAMANAPPRATPVSLRLAAAKAEEVDDHLCRPFDLLHRVARRRADRDRLQRRLPDRPPARRRHHEPRPLHALLAVSGPRHRACAARLGR